MRNRFLALVAIVALLPIAATGCQGASLEGVAKEYVARLDNAVAQEDGAKIAAVAGDIDSWLDGLDAVEAVAARRSLVELADYGNGARAVMLTLLYNAYWAGWELSKQCCDSLLSSQSRQATKPMEKARRAYLLRGLDGDCARFDLAFQEYIDAQPIEWQMSVYARVSTLPRLAAAVAAERKRNPVDAAAAVEALRNILDANDFQEFLNYYQ